MCGIAKVAIAEQKEVLQNSRSSNDAVLQNPRSSSDEASDPSAASLLVRSSLRRRGCAQEAFLMDIEPDASAIANLVRLLCREIARIFKLQPSRHAAVICIDGDGHDL
jgi:hypothetical protein